MAVNKGRFLSQRLLTSGSFSVSMNSAITTTYANDNVRNGNVANIYFGGATSSPISVTPNTTVLGTVPEGYRPMYNTPVDLEFAETTGGTRYYAKAIIGTDGKVYSRHGSSARNMQIILVSGSYGIA